MYCPRCGTENPEHFNFCNSCGLNFAAEHLPLPRMRKPSKHPIIHRPYKAASTISIIGSFISFFLYSTTIIFDVYIESFNLPTSNFIFVFLQLFLSIICGAAGIAGSYLLTKERLIGVIPIFGAALLPTVLYFIYLPMGFASLLFTPLLIAAGLTALIRKKQLDKYYSQP